MSTNAQQLLDHYSPTERDLLERVLLALRDIRFGSIEIVVHEGAVIQFERREKVRRDK